MQTFLKILIFQILIIILIVDPPISNAQDESQCLEIVEPESIPTEILNYASNIVVGYRSTGTFEPIILTNQDNSIDSLFQFELPYLMEDFSPRYTVVELSPDHQKIMQIFSPNGMNDLMLRISQVIDSNIELIEIDNITDVGIAPTWLNSETILLDSQQSETAIYLYDVLTIQDSSLSTIIFNLESQPRQLFDPQIAPDLSQIAFGGLENSTRSIYIYSETTQESVSIFNTISGEVELQWSPQGNYINILSESNSARFPDLIQVVDKTGDILVSQQLLYGDPFVPPLNSEIIWAPDESYIAYQNQATEFRGQTGSLTSIVDIETEEVMNVCIPGNLFWSPDSQYAAMFLRTAPSSNPPNRVLGLFVIDINLQAIYEIPIDQMNDIALEVGWLDINLDN